MRGKVCISVGWLSLCAALAHCGGNTKLAQAPVESEPVADAAAPDAEGGAGGAASEVVAAPAPETNEPPAPLVARAVDKTGEPTEQEEGNLGVRFEVVELGPEDWAYAVVNRGTEKVEVAVDPRLLRFELEPPPDPNAKKWTPKPKVKTCELPAELRPGVVDRHFVVVLEPGQGVVEAFDPRLYCLPENGVSPLVPGARLTPHFGFAPKTKTLWKAGKRETIPLPQQQEPFVARVVGKSNEAEQAHDAGTGGGAGDDASERDPLGQKEFVGSVLELGADYAKKVEAEDSPLVLSMTRGSDARDDRQAIVTVSLSSREKKPVRVYFRRELVSFQVIGPDGQATCSPEPDERAPDRAAFSLLNPGGALTATSRLVELCPEGTFARPGLYLVQGRFDAVATGKEHGFDAFVGTVASSKPAVVRLRRGSLPFPGKRRSKLVRVGENGAPTAPAAEPSPTPEPKASPEAP